MATSPNPYPQPSYWDAVKDRVGELSSMPGEWLRRHLTPEGYTGILHPNARPTAPEEAMPASVDPLKRQAMVEAILQRQQQQQGQPPQGMDQRQLLLQEAARRGIPVPPDSPLLQQGPQGQSTPDNPAGIQF